MKRLFMALAIATVFTACGDDSAKTDVDATTDSTMVSSDTSSSMMNSAPPAMSDSTHADSSHLKTDAPASK